MTKETIAELRLPYPKLGDRRVRVFVPAHEEGETLPVIYMTDGQNLFEEELSTFGCWYTREAVREMREKAGQAAVIVGIFNDGAPQQRTNELTPASIGAIVAHPELGETPNPEGEIFDNFVVNTVTPAVEAQFPVETGRTATAFCGSSSGGLQSFFTVLSHPDRFCAAGVFSPAFLFYSREDRCRWVESRLCATPPYLYFYTGAGDPLEQIIFADTEDTYDDLIERYPPHLLNEIALPEQPHHEAAWAEVFRDFLYTFLTRRKDF